MCDIILKKDIHKQHRNVEEGILMEGQLPWYMKAYGVLLEATIKKESESESEVEYMDILELPILPGVSESFFWNADIV